MTRTSRRSFLQQSSAALTALGTTIGPASRRVLGANGRINVAVIGCGGMGSEHLRILMNRAEQKGDIQVVAVCDLYEKRKQEARAKAKLEQNDVYGSHQELLQRSDVDACFVATPDHWHAPIAIDVMRAGKDLYLEKPMTRTIEEAREVAQVWRETKAVAQIGVQGTSDDAMWQARGLIASGMLGKVVWSQASSSRNSLEGEWNWWIDPDANETNVDWKTWLGSAPYRPWDPDRFFRFRKFWDYSGGIATDLFYHRLGALTVALGAEFPHRVTGTGGIWVQHDSREVPDTFFTTIDYPTEHSVLLVSSMANATGVPTIIRGHEAVLYADKGTLRIVPETIFQKTFRAKHGKDEIVMESRTQANGDVQRSLHHDNFFECIRTRARTHLPPDDGYKVMTAIAMSVQSYREGKMLFWDAERENAIA